MTLRATKPTVRTCWMIPVASIAGFLALAGDVAIAEVETPGPAKAPVEITIDNFTFTPVEVTITPGTTVRWVNHDDIPHTVVETSRIFSSKALDTDDSFSTTFTSVGSFAYFCSLHPNMKGRVIVKAGVP